MGKASTGCGDIGVLGQLLVAVELMVKQVVAIAAVLGDLLVQPDLLDQLAAILLVSVDLSAVEHFAVTVYIYSFKLTSNKNIYTYSPMCIVVVHSHVHLSSSVPSFLTYLFPLLNI